MSILNNLIESMDPDDSGRFASKQLNAQKAGFVWEVLSIVQSLTERKVNVNTCAVEDVFND